MEETIKITKSELKDLVNELLEEKLNSDEFKNFKGYEKLSNNEEKSIKEILKEESIEYEL